MIVCSKCQRPIPVTKINTRALEPCGGCKANLRVEAFPALLRKAAPAPAADTLMPGKEAACFYHPNKKAVVPCDTCGRFLCALCDVTLADRHFCLACLESGKTKRKIERLENNRVLYDDIALSLSILPLLFVFITILTAPAAIYISVRYWNAPSSIIPRTRIRFVLAIVISMMEIAAWAMFLFFRFAN